MAWVPGETFGFSAAAYVSIINVNCHGTPVGVAFYNNKSKKDTGVECQFPFISLSFFYMVISRTSMTG